MLETLDAVKETAIKRRDFLRSVGGGVLVLFTLGEVDAQESGRGGHRGSGNEQLPEDLAAWLHIGPDGAITAFTGKVEVGQNIRTSLTQAVADELRCTPGMVKLIMGDTALTPWDMGTFGSRTTPTMAPILREMAGTAREALAESAAQRWGVKRDEISFDKGCLIGPSGKKLTFGELASKLDWAKTIGQKDSATPADKWIIGGTSVPKVGAREIVTGRHRYPSDQKLPGMLYGRVLRPPSFGAKLTSVDTSAAAAVPGVTVVHDGDFVGVAAANEQLANKTIELIQAKWQETPQISAKDLFAYIKKNGEQSGSAPETQHKSTYTVAYIAHTPLEPRAAVATWSGGKLTVWTGTQRPFGVREELAQAFNLSQADVHVLMPDTGSAYGGKHSGECAVEAARLAKGAGEPVKLIWTREEEFTWAYFRPAGVIEVASGVDRDGRLTSWDFRNNMSGPAGLESPYTAGNEFIHFYPVDSPLREGSYRGLASTANHFARESHIDELAAAAGTDPLAFRLKNLKNDRVRAVLEAAAERFDWPKRKASSNRGFGLACGMDKGGFVACCAEVSITPDRNLRVEHVVEAWDSGAIVNPEHLKNQVEGAIVMGLGGALFEAIDFADGRILNDRFSKYRVPRFSDVPKIDVVLIDRKDVPSAGAGEIPLVGIAPAIANAVYSATKIRIRSMPILPAFQASA
ncbi:MAG: xanthine dehydrogenase family protein molybdopterin-binding subunit [Acidobacteriaceae bacterium]|nr:xanthine dehydrogenase family protein molybdopterin-binding subunit [Acidobacteriaceae bacterium]MBV9499906.1 xanthine dehydrogenase family protein molybdopterin-binding subunit [Acidobacteriaceae bacterium]